jgi:hypothetical protein
MGGSVYCRSFPHCGNIFSTPWKTVTHFFHTMENFSPVFPHHGKKFSTVWKTTGGGDVGEAVEAE